jgi:ribonuclease P protein component
MSIPKTHRFTLSDSSHTSGKTTQNQYFKVVALHKVQTNPRFAIVISKQVSKSSVDRHRIKRQVLSYLYREREILLPLDYTIIVRSPVFDLDQDLLSLLPTSGNTKTQ